MSDAREDWSNAVLPRQVEQVLPSPPAHHSADTDEDSLATREYYSDLPFEQNPRHTPPHHTTPHTGQARPVFLNRLQSYQETKQYRSEPRESAYFLKTALRSFVGAPLQSARISRTHGSKACSSRSVYSVSTGVCVEQRGKQQVVCSK